MIFRVMVLGCLLAVAHRAVSATEIYRTAAQPESAPNTSRWRMAASGILRRAVSTAGAPGARPAHPGDQRFVPLKRLEKQVRFGQLDFICGVGDNPDRRNHFLYLQPPSSPCATTSRCAAMIRSRSASGTTSGLLAKRASSSSITAAAPSNDCRPCRDSSSTAAGSAVLPIMTSC